MKKGEKFKNKKGVKITKMNRGKIYKKNKSVFISFLSPVVSLSFVFFVLAMPFPENATF